MDTLLVGKCPVKGKSKKASRANWQAKASGESGDQEWFLWVYLRVLRQMTWPGHTTEAY
jgi:hypothetical protein